MFTKPSPIHKQIEEYSVFTEQKTPWLAGAESALLQRFALQMNIKDVSDISKDVVAFFVSSQISEYNVQRTLIVIRAFLRYCRWAGYPCIHYIHLTQKNLMKPGPKIDPKKVAKVRELKSRGLSYRAIVSELSKTSKKRVHLTSVVRWGKLST